jgi:uncharacterized protein (TIGR02099 family)
MKLLKKLSRWVFYVVLLLLLLIVLAALAVRFIVFPNIDSYKDDIAAYASKTLGQKVAIGDISTGWDDISPHVALKNIDIIDAEKRVELHLNNVETTFSWLSVPLLQLRLSSLVVHEPELTIRRNADGSIYMAGIDLAGKSKPDFANWLLRQAKVNIQNASVIWQDDLRQAPPLSLQKLNLSLTNPTLQSVFGQHKFTLSALPSIGTKQVITASGRFVGGDISEINTWHGELFTQVKAADLAVWRPWLDYPLDLQSGTGDAQVWLDFANAKIEKVKSHVALNNLAVVANKQATPLVANQLAGDISWSDLKNTQTITAQNIKLNSNTGLTINNGSGFYSTSLKNGKPWVNTEVKLDQFDLAVIKQLAPYVNLPANMRAQLNGFAPTGKLQALNLSWQGEVNAEIAKTSTYKISTAFNQLGLTPYQKVPGFSNLAGKLQANEVGGSVTLQSQNAMLNLKDILRWPIPATQLTGLVSWKVDGDKAKINAKDIFITSPHITGTVNASYDKNNVKGGYLNLTGKFAKGSTKYAPFYYPLILGKTTMDWLDTSILKGHAEDVNLVVKGNLADFPFVNSKNQLDAKLGLFRVTAKVKDAQLEYGKSWPTIEDLEIDLLFEGKRMELNASKGHIFGNKIIKSKTEITQLDADSPILSVVSEVEGPVADGVKFVNASPVKKVTLGFTDDLKTAGRGRLTLDLKMPLRDIEAAKYKGAYQISNGTIFADLKSGLPEMSKINGTLNFTENSLTAQNINTEILGVPAQFGMTTGADKVIRVKANGRITDAGIKKLSTNAFTENIQGSADWVGEITIKKPLVDLNIRSNLVGMAITLPAPFNKSASQSMAFSLDKQQSNLNNDSINISYGNVVAAKILRSDQAGKMTFERGDIGINIAAAPPTQAGLTLHGKLDYVDSVEWLALFDKAKKTDSAEIKINKAEFDIKKLDLFGRSINALKVSAQPNNTGYKLAIESQEITGDVDWKNTGNKKIIARLKSLSIPKTIASVSTNKIEAKKDIRKLDFEYPALDIVADNFEYNQKKLGTLSLSAFENGEDWVVEKMQISNADSTLNVQGNWHNWVRSPNTNFVVAFNSNNINKTLKRFGQPDVVKGGQAEITGVLQWPGSPHEFDAGALSGHLKLDVSKGQFLKVDPSVGRLLGLLSLQSLPRRLSLDFRDLFSDGFAFDKITATAKIDNGILRSDDFYMTGPAAEAKIKGETNLKTETQRLNVKVIPHVSDSLSLAAFAGGPIAGVAAFVAQKLLKDPFNKIVSTEYTIIGTWDKPQELKSNQDTKKPSNESPLTQ